MLARTLVSLAAPAIVACASLTPAFSAPPDTVDLDLDIDVDVGEPVMLAGAAQSAYIKITLGGFALPADQRSPVNVAIVLDRSSSMAGDKLEKAKAAALMVVDRLRPDDVISVVTYDSTVEVLIPATKADDPDRLRALIGELTPRGSTALYDGVTHGLEEVGKKFDPTRVNRIILLSDGQANVGPSSPAEVGALGEVAARQGITITTIGLGLGYNEDLMTQLALRSDGNHAFAENAADLAAVFEHELGDILSVVAQDVEVEIELDRGIQPVRALGRDAVIDGRKARVKLSQLYAAQDKYVLFEVKVPPGVAGKKRNLADVTVRYANMTDHATATKRRKVGVAFTRDAKTVAARQDKGVMVAAVQEIATDENRRAVTLRDEGRVDDARRVLEDNARYLETEGSRLGSAELEAYGTRNSYDADNLGADAWEVSRKGMREIQVKNSRQRGW